MCDQDQLSKKPLLQMIDFSYELNDHYLFSNINLNFYKGEALLIEGKNGSGKTTFLRTLLGLNELTSGQLLYHGKVINKNKLNFYKDILYLGHNTGVIETLTVKENIQYMLALANTLYDLKKTKIALEKLNIIEYIDTITSNLSQGQKWRVVLSRIFLSKAKIWILDEPFTSLDKQGIQFLINEFIKHIKQGGSLIFTSHIPISLKSVPVIRLSL